MEGKSQNPPKTDLNRIVSISFDKNYHLNVIDFLQKSGIMEGFHQSSFYSKYTSLSNFPRFYQSSFYSKYTISDLKVLPLFYVQCIIISLAELQCWYKKPHPSTPNIPSLLVQLVERWTDNSRFMGSSPACCRILFVYAMHKHFVIFFGQKNMNLTY